MQRRRFLQGSAGLASSVALGACVSSSQSSSGKLHTGLPVQMPPLKRIEARPDRIITMNVCTRPFRAQGPRIELEKAGAKSIVHNYGHGGSGWSLSWGTAVLAESLVAEAMNKEIAVIGCGAIGLTTAIQCQRAGYKVKIYAKERPPYVRSSFATGIWSPDSRIVDLAHADSFAQKWEMMARISFRRYQTLLGLTGTPVEWTTIFRASDTPFSETGHYEAKGEPAYPTFERDLIGDITPQSWDIPAHMNPFPVPYVRRYPLLMFNISEYSRVLMSEFIQNGGEILTRELTSPSDFANFDENTLVNCTGYGARALLGDDSITPVRGQTCKLIPQPEVKYGIQYFNKHVSVYPRRDGLLVQAGGDHDFGNPAANIDPEESLSAVARLADFIAAMKAG
ncbi:MAG: FAD-dependent oxidoreductase [Pseudomonadota bacterium]|nr:FAD-dependent oxidoreductase [Pseudomonadota bacterium]